MALKIERGSPEWLALVAKHPALFVVAINYMAPEEKAILKANVISNEKSETTKPDQEADQPKL